MNIYKSVSKFLPSGFGLILAVLFLSSFTTEESRYEALLIKVKSLISENPDSVIILATDIFQNSAVDSTKAKAAYFLGVAYYFNGMYHASESRYEDALRCKFASTDRRFRSKIKNNLGVLYDLTGNYPKAVEAYLVSAEIDRKMGDSMGMMQSWLNIALVYVNMKQFGSARKYLEMTKGYFESVNDTANFALWYQDFGKLENDMRHPVQALLLLRKSAELHKTSGNEYEYLNALLFMASIETSINQYDKALELLTVIEKTSREKNYTSILNRCKLSLTDLYIRLGNISKARAALAGTRGFDGISIYKKALLDLAIKIDTVHTAQTLDYLNYFSDFNDSLINAGNASLVNELQIRFETDNKTKNIQYQHEKLQLQQKRLLYSLFGLIIFILLSVTIFYYYIRLRKTYRILCENLQNSPGPYPVTEDKSDASNLGVKHDNLAPDAFDELWENILHILKNEKLYLNPILKTDDIAKACNTNKTYIYQVIKEKAEDNFNTLINRFRVDEARKLMEEHPEYSPETVASLSGFNSKSSFYRAFRSVTGLAPGQYQVFLLNNKH